MKVTEIQTAVGQLQEAEDRRGRATTEAYQRVLGAQRSAVVPIRDTRATTSTPAGTAPVTPLVATPPVPQTSAEVFADVVLSTPSLHTRAPGDHAYSVA